MWSTFPDILSLSLSLMAMSLRGMHWGMDATLSLHRMLSAGGRGEGEDEVYCRKEKCIPLCLLVSKCRSVNTLCLCLSPVSCVANRKVQGQAWCVCDADLSHACLNL